jgi:hypothetical protein
MTEDSTDHVGRATDITERRVKQGAGQPQEAPGAPIAESLTDDDPEPVTS